jgi:hypothetical protein
MSGPSSRAPEGLAEPLPRPLADALRRAALAQATTEHRRRFPVVVHVGDPGGAEEAFALAAGEPDDHATRTDVLAAMVSRVGRRPGRHGLARGGAIGGRRGRAAAGLRGRHP